METFFFKLLFQTFKLAHKCEELQVIGKSLKVQEASISVLSRDLQLFNVSPIITMNFLFLFDVVKMQCFCYRRNLS